MGTTFSNGYALLIGVGDDLPVTVEDATALQKILINPARAAYAPDHVHLLTETQATRKRIIDAFDTLIKQVNDNGDATVIIYFSGHGVQVPMKDGKFAYFLLPNGYDLNRLAETTIAGSEFMAKIDALKARKLVVLLDCCHAEGIPIRKGPQAVAAKSVSPPPDLLNTLNQGRGRIIVASCQQDERSYMGDTYSIFTACLLEALSGKAAVRPDGFARILDTVIYLQDQVPRRAAPLLQHPFVNEISNLDDNFPLCYYAGGSKALPVTDIPTAPLPGTSRSPVTTLTSTERLWLEQENNRLQRDRDTLEGRIDRLSRTKSFEINEEKIDHLKYRIQEIQKEKDTIEARIKEIQEKLR